MAEEVSKKTPSKEPGNQPKKPDDMLNLFATQVAEENVLGKFAASLRDIDAADLLKDAIDVRDRLKGRRR